MEVRILSSRPNIMKDNYDFSVGIRGKYSRSEIAAADMEPEKQETILRRSLSMEECLGLEDEDPTKFRNLVKQVSGADISSAQAKNFLEIFGEQLAAELTQARRNFIERHFGNKYINQE